MKQIIAAAVVALALLAPSRSFALSGGPFGTGQPDNVNANGTYNGVMSGKNLTGSVTFGVSSNQETNGRFVVFHRGILSYGNASGVADVSARTLAGAMMGVAALPGETTGASSIPAQTTQTITVRGGAEGMFTAKMKGYPANIIFEGKGEMSTVANTASTVNSTVTVAGVTTVSSSASRQTTSIRVRGSRTSTSPYILTNSITALPPRTPATPVPSTPGTTSPTP